MTHLPYVGYAVSDERFFLPDFALKRWYSWPQRLFYLLPEDSLGFTLSVSFSVAYNWLLAQERGWNSFSPDFLESETDCLPSCFAVPDGYSGYLPPPTHHQQQQAYHHQTAPQQFAAPPAIPTPVIQAATSSVNDDLYMLDIGFPPRTKKKMKKPKSGEPGAVKRKSREGESPEKWR